MLPRESCPLTAYQLDIWVSAARFENSPQYNLMLNLRLDGEIDLARLAAGVEEVLQRHESLRTRFDAQDGVPFQWVAAEAPAVEVLDLSGAPDPAAACRRWAHQAQQRPMQLRRSSMTRVAVLLAAPDVAHVVVVAHHLVADGWSVHLLRSQLLAACSATADGGQESRPYRSFIPEEAAYRESDTYRRDRDFHHSTMTGATPALFSRKPAYSPREGARYSFSLPGSWVERVKAAKLPVFAYISAMLGVYLSRVHRTEEVTLGIPLLNRTREFLGTSGHFANTLPLRIATPGEQSVRELVGEIQSATRRLQVHQRAPLGDVLRGLPTEHRQLFDVTLSYLRLPALAAAEFTHQTFASTPCHEQDALSVMVLAFEDGEVRFDLDYASDVFDAGFPIEALAGQLRNLLERGVDLAEQPVSAVPMLSAAERAQLIGYGRGEEVPFRDEATLSGLFEEQTARRPEQVALTWPGGAMTYAELDRAANQVARGLRAGGVGRGDRVAVLLERGPDLLVALFGILKAGAAYVPVDPGYPAERIGFLLADSRPAAVLVADPGLLGGWAGEAPVWRVAELRHGDDSPLTPQATATDLAYVIYTSGSSGRPKGVRVQHRSVVNRLAWMQRRYPLSAGDVLLQKTPVSFDVSVWELFWWAIEGASVALLPPGAEKDPREIWAAVREHGVTVLHFVPSMLGTFLDSGAPDAGTLRLVFCSGEALPAARVEQFNRLFHRDGRETPALVNLYGPTEATVDVTCHDCPGDPAEQVDLVPIGRPIDNIQLYVTGRDGELQPAGTPGELCIGGVGVAAGYLDRPGLTAERFIPDTFTGTGTLYRTGDLVRWLPDRSLEYLGRLDDQVKIRGNRVELGEVANALLALPGVRDALVVDRTTPERGTHLVGYYVAGAALDAEDLRAELARTLPEFMIPVYFVPLERIPLTPNGKADRRALPAPVPVATTLDRPLTSTEAVLAEIFADVLGCGPVSARDNFHALGGDSLLMLRVRARAEQRGLRFSLADIAQHPTVAALAALAVPATESAEESPEPFALICAEDRVRLGEAADAYPLSRLQLGLIYHSRRQPESAVYKDVFRYTLRMRWDEPGFRAAFTRLATRHPALRTSFRLAGHAEPLQVVHPAVPAGLEIIDLRGEPEAEAEVLRHIEQRRHHDYAFDTAPLYLFRAHVRESVVDLVLSFHHALLDGGSVANLMSELLRDYGHALGLDLSPAPETALPAPAAQIGAERQALSNVDSARYWRDRLDGSEPTSIGAFRPHTGPATGGLSLQVDLPERLGEQVRAFAKEHALPVKSVLFAAHCLTLRLLSGSTDITTGLITHVRPELDGAERIAGLFLNTLPLRVDTAGDSWGEVVRAALRGEQSAYPHRRYPLSAIQQDRGRELIASAFNYIRFDQLSQVLRQPGIELAAFHGYEETNFPVLVNAVTDPVSNHLWLRLDGDGELVTEDQLRLLGDYFTRILDRLVHRPEEQPNWDFLTGATLPATTRPVARANVVEEFAEQVARTPGAVAVVAADGERWSYARLAATATAVAANLLGAGLAPGAIVGIALDRTPEALAVLLGVLRAGAAVLPLDTGYPATRLARMIEQADPFLIVAEQPELAGRRTVRPAEITNQSTVDTAVPFPLIEPESTAYVLFTSGSTGVPKGITMPHRALANLVSWQNRRPSGQAGLTLQYAPLSFDVSFQEIFSTLCGGGTLRLLTEQTRRDLPELLRLIHRDGVDRVYLPYVALQQLAVAADALGIAPSSLRVIISSGEQLRVTEEIRRLCSANPHLLLENQYGPTETHVVTSHTMSGPPADFPDLPPIGTAIDRTRVQVLDAELRPVPPGVTGELWVSGDCLAHGYLGQPRLTAERFTESGDPLARRYRTGDLGFTLPDGSIVCTGRADSQVKIRGFRVETAEVELAISELAGRFPGLKDAAVIAHPGDGEATLVAYLLGDPASTDTAALRGALREHLPEYLVPTHFQWLDALPATPSGKRDDAALRALPLGPIAERDRTPPRDERERALCEILAELLGLPAIGVHENIFDLGGTSITAMRLVVTVEQRFGTTIPLAEFIAAPTAAGLADRLRRAGAEQAPFHPLVPLRPAGDRPPLFLVHPMGGSVLCYLPFARRLPPGQPLYALQAAGADPGAEPLGSMAEIAASYLAALKEVQPHGPYAISGWSFGGFVAFEMARQLRAAGEEVGKLILLDTVAVNHDHPARHTEDALLGWFFWELLWLRRGSSAQLPPIPPELTSLSEKFDHLARQAVELGVLPAGSSGAVIRRLFRLYRANWQATERYRPESAEQDLVLLRAEEPLPEVLLAMHGSVGSRHQDPANGWRELSHGRIEVIGVPGDHLTIMEEPHVAQVAQVVGDLLSPNHAQEN